VTDPCRALRIARADLRWSLGELARITTIPVGTLSRYEAGRMLPSGDNLSILRAALGDALAIAEQHYGRVPTRERGRRGERWAEPAPSAA